MQETFETRPILAVKTLRELQQKNDNASAVRLVVHLLMFAVLLVLVSRTAKSPLLVFALSIALAWVWSGLFAPFHECTHQTAFRTPNLNKLGTWLTGIPFCMAPSVYGTFHFEHHRYTQDPERDPEIMDDPRYQHWPTGLRNWLMMATGTGLLHLKFAPLLGFALKPRSRWDEFAKWAPLAKDPDALVTECRIVLGLWIAFIVSCVTWIPGGGWLLFAAWFAHVFQTLWVASEHTGLPTKGSILARTRTVKTNPFVRFWLWNMNYHAEHHAWPSIPWHRLPDAHAQISDQLESFIPGYLRLHDNIIHARNVPSCDSSPTTS